MLATGRYIGEGFDDIVKYHPTHEESPVAPKDAIPKMIPGPLMELRAAVDKKDMKAFGAAYDSLTQACNDCHRATNFGFAAVPRTMLDLAAARRRTVALRPRITAAQEAVNRARQKSKIVQFQNLIQEFARIIPGSCGAVLMNHSPCFHED